jgi:hypothetical protein
VTDPESGADLESATGQALGDDRARVTGQASAIDPASETSQVSAIDPASETGQVSAIDPASEIGQVSAIDPAPAKSAAVSTRAMALDRRRITTGEARTGATIKDGPTDTGMVTTPMITGDGDGAGSLPGPRSA